MNDELKQMNNTNDKHKHKIVIFLFNKNMFVCVEYMLAHPYPPTGHLIIRDQAPTPNIPSTILYNCSIN